MAKLKLFALCDAFAELFGLERVGIDDDFFLLGGDSIRVMQLQQLCEELPLTTKIISAGRTPRKIAAAVENLAPSAGADRKAPQPTPLTQTQLGIYVESMARAGEAVYNNPVLLKLDPALDANKLASAIEAAIEAHAFVKLHIEENAEGVPLMVSGDTPYSQAVEEVSEVEFEALKPTFIQPFNLHEGPLFRIRVIRTPEELYLFTDFHHIIYDGTSMRAFMADVDRAYAGEAIEPERYTGFDIALEEAQARATSAYDEAKSYYEETFGSLDVDSTPIPDRSADEVEFETIEMPLEIERDTLHRFCTRIGITENVFAIAAFGKLLGSYANLSESLFATIYNGRADLRCARTVSMMGTRPHASPST